MANGLCAMSVTRLRLPPKRHAKIEMEVVTMLNKKTGHFNVTAPRIARWWRRPGDPPTLNEAAELFSGSGIKVYSIQEKYIECEFDPDRIWQVLSGLPSNPKYLKHYENQFKKWKAGQGSMAKVDID